MKKTSNKTPNNTVQTGPPVLKNPWWKIITENLECLAVAGAMALIINLFFLQAYKIPTGSMQPTIIGNEEQGIFDRILVNKFVYLIRDPERWEIVVFKYPLNQSENYIKRLVGLPGETIEI
ncbi:MAG: signal peptidase I, partial [Planctomycetes bacterium]|nr:signal peptidase I [Planctomycetota bacterium]